MGKTQFDMKLFQQLKDLFLRIHQGETIRDDFHQHVKEVSAIQLLLTIHELKSADLGITSQDVKEIFSIYKELYGHSITVSPAYHSGHPIQIFKAENREMESILNRIDSLMDSIEKNEQALSEVDLIDDLKEQMNVLGQFYNHYNRKEKLYFPILERFGHYTLPRTMWGEDDRIRNFYKGTKSMMEKIPHIEFRYVKKSFELFARHFKEMIFEEESFLLPITQITFQERDWLAIAKESEAFGYAIVEPLDEWVPKVEEQSLKNEKEDADLASKHLAFGGGYLTVQEANNILNNLPLEITFVDKNGLFKYFNERLDASEMMLVRTPTSIGRHVANCHPPRSLKKVMKLIRDLKSKKRTSESMWFKKKDQYIHITYKGLFDDDGEFLGILEYVQDIQPFLDLPREIKRELSIFDE